MVQLADQSGVSVLHSRRDRREPFLPGGKERAEGEGQGKGKARVSTWKRRRWLAWLTRRRGGRRRMAVTLFAEFQPHPSPHEEKKNPKHYTRARARTLFYSPTGAKRFAAIFAPRRISSLPGYFLFLGLDLGFEFGASGSLSLSPSLSRPCSKRQAAEARTVCTVRYSTNHASSGFLRPIRLFFLLFEGGRERERASPPLLARCFACPP